jgi:hypothetical protein
LRGGESAGREKSGEKYGQKWEYPKLDHRLLFD